MALRLLPVALLAIAALAVSGCSGKDAAADDLSASPDPPVSGHPETMAPQSVAATRLAQETPMHVEGSTYTGGCAYAMGQGACRWEAGDHAFVELGKDGQPARFAGSLAWTATTPASQEMSVYVLHLRDDGYYWFDDASPTADGASPLDFDFDLSAYNDTQVAFGISATEGRGALVAYAAVGVPQDFVLDATYTSIVLRA